MKITRLLFGVATLSIATLLLGCDGQEVAEPEAPDADMNADANYEAADLTPDAVPSPQTSADAGRTERTVLRPASPPQPEQSAAETSGTDKPSEASSSRQAASQSATDSGGDDVGGKDVEEEPASELPKKSEQEPSGAGQSKSPGNGSDDNKGGEGNAEEGNSK